MVDAAPLTSLYVQTLEPKLATGDATEHVHLSTLEALAESLGDDANAMNEQMSHTSEAFLRTSENQVGGYRVLYGWLKDRKGRQLSHDDLDHCQKIVVALKETMRLMDETDGTIPQWPIE